MSQVKLDNWRGHVQAALQAKQPFTQYAREHGLSRHTLYVAHKLMKANGELPVSATPKRAPRMPPVRPAFVPVRVTPAVSAALEIHWRRDIVLRLPPSVSPAWLADVLHRLGG